MCLVGLLRLLPYISGSGIRKQDCVDYKMMMPFRQPSHYVSCPYDVLPPRCPYSGQCADIGKLSCSGICNMYHSFQLIEEYAIAYVR